MKSILKSFMLSGALLVAVTGAPGAVIAQQPTRAHEARETSQTHKTDIEERKAQAEIRQEKAKTRATEKRDEAKLRACQNREKAVTNIMARIVDRGEKHIALFNTIATRTQAFYEEKGYSVENYDELVANTEAARAEALDHLEVLKAENNFNCESEDPKAFVSAFKDALKIQIDSLKEYRTAVKDLIVGVKSAQSQGEAESEDKSEEEVETEVTDNE